MDADEFALKRKEYKLEVWKLFISILTPLALLALTFVVNSAIQERGARLKRDEQILAEKQKIYAELGRRLNIIYVYIDDVGDFKSYTPPRIVELKRETDRQFFMYRPYWSEATEQKYNDYMKAAFRTYTGVGKPAQINTHNKEKVAAYKFDKLQWDADWDAYFTGVSDPGIGFKYDALAASFISDTVSASVRKLDR